MLQVYNTGRTTCHMGSAINNPLSVHSVCAVVEVMKSKTARDNCSNVVWRTGDDISSLLKYRKPTLKKTTSKIHLWKSICGCIIILYIIFPVSHFSNELKWINILCKNDSKACKLRYSVPNILAFCESLCSCPQIFAAFTLMEI